MRIEPLEDKQISWMLKPLTWMMKRRFGKVLNPIKAWAYRPGLTLAMAIFTQSVEASKVTDPTLKRMVCLRAAQMIGCVFWIDINAAGGSHVGISEDKLATIADYVENPLFTPAECAALRYTEEMTQSSIDVPDEVFEELQRHFNTEQIVDLTATVAMENMRARFNRALQVESDGICRLPAHHPALTATPRG
jgi:alkylhydroperoxidase family enzyme